ncbi:MAG TPA: hypothetical protein VJU59_38320 [Paraburkholderia sp.]|uniref:hypothetical protein n=1 Tax=Paraburkholderia sp. TaxID=1926495 RepID=UPI002B463CE9|nr:hypothetical protein [Paraburkholderia sp.]HKR45465.1 hypothetical protein [Paraburkholderia sp.]
MIVLELNKNGLYVKSFGEPLKPCQVVMLRDDLYELPRHYEEDRGEILTARKWRIATYHGHHILIEYLPKGRNGWPWGTP